MTEFARMSEMFASLHGDIENPFLKEEIRLHNGNTLTASKFLCLFYDAFKCFS